MVDLTGESPSSTTTTIYSIDSDAEDEDSVPSSKPSSSKSSSSKPSSSGSTHESAVDLTVPSPPQSPLVAPRRAASSAGPPAAAAPVVVATAGVLALEPGYVLRAGQQAAVDYMVKTEGNGFLTGSAGTGKSLALLAIIDGTRAKYPHPGEVAVTANSALVASFIGGSTLHSFAGIGLGMGDRNGILRTARANPHCKLRWKKVKLLIVDEVGMFGGSTLELIDFIARNIRGEFDPKNFTLPFGGVRFLGCGDFSQLPAIQGGFAFESEVWTELNMRNLVLREVVRQSNDVPFTRMLESARRGVVTLELRRALELASQRRIPDGTFVDPKTGEYEIAPVHLYCTNAEVAKENDRRLKALPGPAMTFLAGDREYNCNNNQYLCEKANAAVECLAPYRLTLKVGAQVVCTRRPTGLTIFNGLRGVVVELKLNDPDNENSGYHPVVRYEDGQLIEHMQCDFNPSPYNPDAPHIRRQQFPLRLAYALSIHRSQGMSLSQAVLNVSNCFDFGQGYTALSRLLSLEGLFLTGQITHNSFRASAAVLKWYAANGI